MTFQNVNVDQREFLNYPFPFFFNFESNDSFIVECQLYDAPLMILSPTLMIYPLLPFIFFLFISYWKDRKS